MVLSKKSGLYKENGDLYYYANGKKTYAGLIFYNGYYYYINSSKKAVTGTYYVTKHNDLMPSDYYEFDSKGRMLMADKSGVVQEADGIFYYDAYGRKDAAGLVKIDGYTYYVDEYGKVMTGTYTVTKDNGSLPADVYEFDEQGRLVVGNRNGFVEKDGAIYYYVDGIKNYAGLINVDGDYYYVNSKYKVVTGSYKITKHNNLLPKATYEFGSDGRMKQGFVPEDGEIHYYVNGQRPYAGLIYVDGYYYYVNSKLKVVTGTYTISKHNDLLPKGTYEFDSQGRMIIENTDDDQPQNPDQNVKNGFIRENGELRYYVNGERPYAGLIYVDGNYYYVNSKLKVVTGSYKVYKHNNLLPKGIYEFDSDGKMKHGFIEENGEIHYYVNGKRPYAGLIYVDGYYYYVNSKLKVVTGSYNIYKHNDLLPRATYQFDEQGRLRIDRGDVKDGFIREDGELHYYVNGVQPYAGLIYVDGYYYYVNSKLKVVTGSYNIYKHNDLLPKATYKFDSQGRMILG